MFRLRPAQRADSSTIRLLVYRERLNPLGLDWRRFMVAESAQGQVIGCAQVRPHAGGARELASLVVAPEWRLRGVARTLIERLVEAHPGPLYLTCRASLGFFYVRFGFRVIEEAEMPRYFQLVSRLFRFGQRLLRSREGLLVMKRVG